MTDKISRFLPSALSVCACVVGMHGLIQSGDTSLMSFCQVYWLAWMVLLLARLMREFLVVLMRGDSCIHPSVLEPIILIPLSHIPVDVIERSATELSIEPIWVCIVTAGLAVMGTIRLSEVILSRILDPLMGLLFRTSRKVVSRRYAKKVPVICRNCVYCTAHTHMLCAIRPLGPESPRFCSSLKARKN